MNMVFRPFQSHRARAAFLAALLLTFALPIRGNAAEIAVLGAGGDAAAPAVRFETVTVRKGDTLMELLVAADADRRIADRAIAALRTVYDPRKLKIGQKIQLGFTPPVAGMRAELASLSLRADAAHEIEVRRAGDTFAADRRDIPLTARLAYREGSISLSLFEAARDADVPLPVLFRLIGLFSYEVDFQRDPQPDDTFEVVFERMADDSGKILREGEILRAAMTLSGTQIAIYRYTDSTGNTDFYNEKGESFRRALLRTPLDGARLSSGYGRRLHPILGYNKMHRGVDFAAPRGTPIYAAGSGTIARIGRWGAYGNYVRIRHNDTYATAYAHLSRYARGLKRGGRVRQGEVIGYVGNTGRSTGPHLHYEILKNGRQVNPFKVKMPPTRKLAGAELERFRGRTDQLDRLAAAHRPAHDQTAALDRP